MQEVGNVSTVNGVGKAAAGGNHEHDNGIAGSAQPKSTTAVHNLFSSFSTPNEPAAKDTNAHPTYSQETSTLTPNTISPAMRGAPSTMGPPPTLPLPAELRSSVGDATLAAGVGMSGSQGHPSSQITPSAFTTPSPVAAGIGIGPTGVPLSGQAASRGAVLNAPQKAPAPQLLPGQVRQVVRGTKGAYSCWNKALEPK